MALRFVPHGEDFGATAGGDGEAGDFGSRVRARPVRFSSGPALGNSPNSPPGEGKNFVGATSRGSFRGDYSKQEFGADQPFENDELENEAQRQSEDDGYEPAEDSIDFLKLLREAEATSASYVTQTNRREWTQSLRAYNNQHFSGAKYTRPEWRNRSKFHRPKTRTTVKKDMAAVAASLHGNLDAISCLPGNESDPRQRAGAAVIEELVNYRTDGSRGKAAIPWFQVSMGARQDALLAGVCLSKQTWKLEHRKLPRPERVEVDGQTVLRDVYVIDTDRPDCQLIPPENFSLDPAADWTDPVQSASYIIIKWPMTLDDVLKKQKNPINPWLEVSASKLLPNSDSGTTDTAQIRRAREGGIDRMEEARAGRKFQIVWVYETYMRIEGEDYTFFSAGTQAYLTDPKPVREVYPEQFGQRPLVMGYGNLDAHRIFPMSPVASLQQHQQILNDIANLSIDAVKQNVFPITKVVRGKQVDLEQVKKRAHGSIVMVQEEKDVTFDRPTDIPASVSGLTREVELEADDLMGQFNGQTAENNNALSRTLGGLKLVAGSANAVQEYDIRVWIQTWAAPVLAQIVRLEQFYEHDAVVLGLCGDRAQLMEKFGVSQITDELIEQDVLISVSVGLGAGDPAQRLQKFGQAVAIITPILQASPDFQSGKKRINVEAVIAEIFGDTGFRDGGARFFEDGEAQPQGDPLMDLKAALIKSNIEKNQQTAKASVLTALAAVAKAALGEHEFENQKVNEMLGLHLQATDMGFRHGQDHNKTMLAASDHGHRHGMAVRQQGHQERMPQPGPDGASSAASGSAPDAPQTPPVAPQGSPVAPVPSPSASGHPLGSPPQQGVPVSMAVREASAEPPPPPNSQPISAQQTVETSRRGPRFIEAVRHPDGTLRGYMLHDQMPEIPPPPPPGPPPMPPWTAQG